MRSRKTTAFYVETLVLTAFLLALLVVLVQMFAAARAMGRTARQETAAALLAQNASAAFSVGEGELGGLAEACGGTGEPQSLTLCYGEDGSRQDEGDYAVTWQLTGQEAPAGSLVYAAITVETREGQAQGSEPLCRLETARYLPGAGTPTL